MHRRRFAILAVATTGYLLTGVAIVAPGERLVVRRFGRVVAVATPGLWVGLPWGIDRRDRVAADRVRRLTVGDEPEQYLTGDHNLVAVRAALDVSVRPDAVADFALNADRADAVVRRAAESALAEWIAARPVDDVLLAGPATLPPRLAAAVRARIAPLNLGVEVQAASVPLLAPPDEVRESFDAVARAQSGIRTAEQAARQDADRRRREAEAEAFRLQAVATADAHRLRTLAHADAEAFGRRATQARAMLATHPDAWRTIWWDEVGRLLLRMKANGRIDVLDSHLGRDGLEVWQPVPPAKPR